MGKSFLKLHKLPIRLAIDHIVSLAFIEVVVDVKGLDKADAMPFGFISFMDSGCDVFGAYLVSVYLEDVMNLFGCSSGGFLGFCRF